MEAAQVQTSGTAVELLEAAEQCLRHHGLAGFSTRRVAEIANTPLSQIHYHFGSKQQLLLALLQHQNAKLLQRQEHMYAQPLPLWKRWVLACDYLEEDLASGYVRVLQEMIAAGWSDPEFAGPVRQVLNGWYGLIARVAKEAAPWTGGLGGFTPDEVAALVGNLFVGTEAMLVLGLEHSQHHALSALRKFGRIIRAAETGESGETHESA